MQLNRIVLAWKVIIRKKKVRRLQFTIASHEHYRRVLRETFHELCRATILQREFRERVDQVITSSKMRAMADAFERLQMELMRSHRLDAKGKEAAHRQREKERQKAF